MTEQVNRRDRAATIDSGLGAVQRWCVRIVVIAVAAAILGWLIGKLWVVVFPVIMAVIVSTVLAPPVMWLRRKRWNAGAAAATVMLVFMEIVMFIVVILTPRVSGQVDDIAFSASGGLEAVRIWLTEGPLGLSSGQITSAINALQSKLRESAGMIGSGLFSTVATATSFFVGLVLVVLLTYFFLRDGDRFLPWLRRLCGERPGAHIDAVLRRAWVTLGSFVRTQGLVALIDAVLIGVGLLIVGVPLAIPLAVVTFVGSFVPIVGALVAGALAVLVALVTNGATDALIVLAIVVGVQQLEGNLLQPWLQGRSLNLHPVVILLALTAGATLWGITGAFLAVPVAATIGELFRYIDERVEVASEGDAPSGVVQTLDSE